MLVVSMTFEIFNRKSSKIPIFPPKKYFFFANSERIQKKNFGKMISSPSILIKTAQMVNNIPKIQK